MWLRVAVTAFAWIGRVALLALAILAMSIASRRQPAAWHVTATRCEAVDDRVEGAGWSAWYEDGWVGVGWWSDVLREGWLVEGRIRAQEHGKGWRVERGEGPPAWLQLTSRAVDGRWVRWDVRAWGRTGVEAQRRAVSMPAWLVAAAAAAWPVGTAARLARAGYRRWRAARGGLCRRCGYDLRASPERGTLVERCPECGQATARR
jgi:hypothetical protein